ncbi:hypothetical protein EF912_10170 [Streptomyces sp. WAC07061]|uniref:hypothetical protein n=1 Tax=Streptomyces sp. WAC07061 TaxID=2487410 RepID=UPI000F7AD189|nr:hypothetical protein [Streptomyces sp. WAC07061]RSS60430.1 hypothetical protein EF912_10170 [Streptomyces sp. WAC07061]
MATGIGFLIAFGFGQWDPFGWFPEKDSDRISVAGAFAGAMAAVIALAVGWWAGGSGGSSSSQRARASGTSQINQSVGGAAPGGVNQHARADGDSRIDQRHGGEAEEQSS